MLNTEMYFKFCENKHYPQTEETAEFFLIAKFDELSYILYTPKFDLKVECKIIMEDSEKESGKWYKEYTHVILRNELSSDKEINCHFFEVCVYRKYKPKSKKK